MNLFTFVFWLLMFYPCRWITAYCKIEFYSKVTRFESFDTKEHNIQNIIYFVIYVIGATLLFINL